MNDDHDLIPPYDDGDDDDEAPSIEQLRDDAPLTTDSANAESVVREHGKGYLFVLAWSAWLAWDGRRWSPEGARGKLQESIKNAMRLEWSRAIARLRSAEERIQKAAITMQKDEAAEAWAKREKGLVKWYEQSQNQAKIESCTKRLEAMLPIAHAQLDRAPWLLNCTNGTVDLRTAELRPHERDDLLTQIADVAYDDAATCPTWEAFVRGAMGGDIGLALYLQRWAGYMATGNVSEHAMLFLYGGGRNGKSTFVTTLCKVLGEYACSAPRDLLFVSKGDRHPAEIARLHGKRTVSCAEIPENAQLDEAKVKDLTGGDVIAARRMREDFWDLHPTHAFIVSGNHKPNIQGSDEGIWRRIRLVPWTVTIDEGAVDKSLPEKLFAEREGIVRWIVQGCLEWQRIGLADPEIVRGATDEYREESDTLGQFFDERVTFGVEEKCARSDLRLQYEQWCAEAGHKPLGAKRIAARLREKGVANGKDYSNGKTRDGWKGVSLKLTTETPPYRTSYAWKTEN